MSTASIAIEKARIYEYLPKQLLTPSGSVEIPVTSSGDRLFLTFTVPEEYKHKYISATLGYSAATKWNTTLTVKSLNTPYSDNWALENGWRIASYDHFSEDVASQKLTADNYYPYYYTYATKMTVDCLRNGICLLQTNRYTMNFSSVSCSIEYTDIKLQANPIIKRYNKRQDNILSWTIKYDYTETQFGGVFEYPAPATTLVEWKNGTSGTVHEITVTGNSTSTTIEANTLPVTSDLMFRVKITSDDGVTGDWSDWATCEVEEGYLIATNLTPSGGYVDDEIQNIFTFNAVPNDSTYTGLSLVDADFEWKYEGTTHTINIGAVTSCAIAANTFPSDDDFEWRIKITDNYSQEFTTDWKQMTTSESIPSVTAVSPKSEFVTGSNPVRFNWALVWTAGGKQAAYKVDAKLVSGDSWSTIATGSGSEPYCDILPSAFQSGTNEWKVQIENGDGDESSWSNALQIVAVVAPAAPTIRMIRNSPKPIIGWQSATQQAYQIRIGDYDSGTVFGTEQEHECKEILKNGETVAKVRIMNEYSMWSDWSELTFTVLNTGGGSLPIQVYADIDATIRWSEIAAAVEYAVYKDDVLIGKTEGLEYVDKTANGKSTYYVLAVMADGNYTRSNTVEKTTTIECPMIAKADGGNWIELRYTSDALPFTSDKKYREVTLTQYNSHEYPVAERTNKKNRTYTVSAAFRTEADTTELENLTGEEIIFKDQYGTVLRGVFFLVSKSSNRIIKTIGFEINQVD